MYAIFRNYHLSQIHKPFKFRFCFCFRRIFAGRRLLSTFIYSRHFFFFSVCMARTNKNLKLAFKQSHICSLYISITILFSFRECGQKKKQLPNKKKGVSPWKHVNTRKGNTTYHVCVCVYSQPLSISAFARMLNLGGVYCVIFGSALPTDVSFFRCCCLIIQLQQVANKSHLIQLQLLSLQLQ